MPARVGAICVMRITPTLPRRCTAKPNAASGYAPVVGHDRHRGDVGPARLVHGVVQLADQRVDAIQCLQRLGRPRKVAVLRAIDADEVQQEHVGRA